MLRSLLAPAALLLGACSSPSSGETPDSGHAVTHDASTTKDAASRDAGVDATPDAPHRADTGVDAHVATDATDAAPASTVPVFTLEAGVTWSSLYRDYFGNPQTASCAGDGNCHGSTSQPGYQVSGFLCPADASVGCYMGITRGGDGGPDLIAPDASFTTDNLSSILCQDEGEIGSMPLGCSYIFTRVDLERIADWIEAGAPGD